MDGVDGWDGMDGWMGVGPLERVLRPVREKLAGMDGCGWMGVEWMRER